MPTHSSAAALALPIASVLVVEDDEDHLRAMCEILQEEGYEAEGAADGSIALERLTSGPTPDAAVVDLMMPVMDGWKLITEMKARPALADIPVIVVSGGGRQALFSAPVSAGYIEKPVPPARLLETLAACLERRRKPSGSHPVDG